MLQGERLVGKTAIETSSPARSGWARRVPAHTGFGLVRAGFLAAAPGLVLLLALIDVQPLVPALVAVLAIAGAAVAGGLWAGLAAGVLSFIPFTYYFTPPGHSFVPSSSEDVGAGLLFLVTAVGVSELIARQQRARAAAEAAAKQAERLQGVAEALSEAVTPQQVLDAVLHEGVSAADARAGLIAVVTEDGEQLEVIAQRGYQDRYVGAEGRWRRFPVSADLPLSEVVRTGTPLFFESHAERDARYPLLRDLDDAAHALACLPLVVEGRVFGGLVFSFASDGHFTDQHRALKLAIARQAAQALDRARMYEFAEAARRRLSFLAEASALLSASLDYEETLRRLARLAVPRLADWCSIDMVVEGGATIERLAVAHQDPTKAAWADELLRRFPTDPDAPTGVPNVLRTGEPEFLPELPQDLLGETGAGDPQLAEVMRDLGLRSWICVPLVARGRVLGALSLIAAESGRIFGRADFELARELADRAAMAADNAGLYRDSERRGDAARALAHIGEGVVLLDRDDRVRFWNPALELLTGVGEADALGKEIVELVPRWRELRDHVAVAGSAKNARPSTLPLTAGGEEQWVSVTAVRFADGSVYALRDVTEEQALERARSEFVATASHELRTPIAAVYGAVRTLRRNDIVLAQKDRDAFLEIIESEGERLSKLVDQILIAGEIGAGTVRIDERLCDLAALADRVLLSARARAPENVTLELRAPEELPLVPCDEDKLRQVLVNLVENAIKYSPDGGEISVELSSKNGHGRIAVRDEGLGIPAAERGRIFEKFYRLDPSLTRGVGGSGLGLYISRELVERMNGRLTVESEPGRGSTFSVEIPTS